MMEGQGKSSIARLFHNTQHILLLKNKNVSQNSLEYFTLFASIELKDGKNTPTNPFYYKITPTDPF